MYAQKQKISAVILSDDDEANVYKALLTIIHSHIAFVYIFSNVTIRAFNSHEKDKVIHI